MRGFDYQVGRPSKDVGLLGDAARWRNILHALLIHVVHVAQFDRVDCGLRQHMPREETANRATPQQTDSDYSHFYALQEINMDRSKHTLERQKMQVGPGTDRSLVAEPAPPASRPGSRSGRVGDFRRLPWVNPLLVGKGARP